MPKERMTAGSVLILTLLLSACRLVNDANLVGTYRGETPCATVTLELKSNHSFVQTQRIESGGTKQVVGGWRLDNGDGEGLGKRVSFDHAFLDLVHDNQGRDVGGASLIAEVMGRSVHIGPVIVACPESTYKIDYVK